MLLINTAINNNNKEYSQVVIDTEINNSLVQLTRAVHNESAWNYIFGGQ